jgi:Cu/Ag efflux protein CusF
MFAAAPLAQAQTAGASHDAHHGAATAAGAVAAGAAAPSTDMSSGEVRRLDKAQKKITLRHGDIRNLEMPPMTMVFQVRDAALLDAVKVGDKVMFVAAKDNDGSLIVTAIRPAP